MWVGLGWGLVVGADLENNVHVIIFSLLCVCPYKTDCHDFLANRDSLSWHISSLLMADVIKRASS